MQVPKQSPFQLQISTLDCSLFLEGCLVIQSTTTHPFSPIYSHILSPILWYYRILCFLFIFFFALLITNTRDLTQKPLGPSTIYTNKSKKQPVLGYSYDKDARIPRCLGLSSGSFSISKLLLLWFEPVVSAPLSSFRVLFA